MRNDEHIFIYGNVPSSKNGKRWTGKILIHSKATQTYIKASKLQYTLFKNKFISLLKGETKPYKISFKFVRGSRHKFDYVNPLQTVQDLMVKHGWIDDDNADEIIPVLEQYEYNKKEPGVIISVIKQDENGKGSKQVLDKNRSRGSSQGSTGKEDGCRTNSKKEGGQERRKRKHSSEDLHSGGELSLADRHRGLWQRTIFDD